MIELVVWLLAAHAWGWILCGLVALRRGRRQRENHAQQLESVRAANRRLQLALDRSVRAPGHLRSWR